MAKLRRNHAQRGGNSSGILPKAGIFAALLGLLYVAFTNVDGLTELFDTGDDYTEQVEDAPDRDIFYLPTSTTGEVIYHDFYTLSYDETHEQAEWVAYELTRSRLNQDWVERSNDFRTDPQVRRGSAQWDDYLHSGYDRGHLVPAADMAFNQTAMSETFYMSNISPQDRKFNGGIWRELEELTRDWAKQFGKLYVVSGPILSENDKKRIGKSNRVTVPSSYYKVLLDLSERDPKAIAFLLPNQPSDQPVTDYAVPVDAVEAITGVDFFPELLEPTLEQELESNFSLRDWRTNERKYRLRVEKWNNR